MSTTTPHQTLTEEVAAFLATGPSPEEMVRFHISEHAQNRVRELLAKQEEGALTPDESAELDEVTVLDQLFTLVRARLLSAQGGADPQGTDA
jgi:hypothetical protein